MTTLIILVTCIVSYLGFTNSTFFEKYKFCPYKINRNKEYIRWISGGFLHADPMHLGFNMVALYSAGQAIEMIYAPWPLLILFYLSAIIISGLPDYIQHKNNPYYSAIGASGAVSAALFSLLIIAPWGTVRVFFIIPLPFILFAILYLYYSYYMSNKNYDNIGHRAHFTGALFGILASIIRIPEAVNSFLSQIMHPPSLSELFR